MRLFMTSWQVFRWRRDSSPKVARRQLPVKLSLEYLEQRLAPATFTVQHFNDSVTDPGSLRYALAHLDTGTAANTNTINIDLVDNFPPASPILALRRSEASKLSRSFLPGFGSGGVALLMVQEEIFQACRFGGGSLAAKVFPTGQHEGSANLLQSDLRIFPPQFLSCAN